MTAPLKTLRTEDVQNCFQKGQTAGHVRSKPGQCSEGVRGHVSFTTTGFFTRKRSPYFLITPCGRSIRVCWLPSSGL